MIKYLVVLLNSSNSLTFSNNTLKICLPNKFMKIGFSRLGRKQLNDEFKQLSFFSLTPLVDLIPRNSLENKLFRSVLELECLFPVERTLEIAKKVYGQFNSLAQNQSLDVEIIPFLKKEIRSLEICSFLDQLQKKVMLIGPIHGDFHLNNIMKNQSDELKIIDLDLSMKSWIRQFDLINVLVSEYILTQGLMWKEAFGVAWENEMELSAIDSAWAVCSQEDKRIHFYLYFVKRTINERIEFNSGEHLKLLETLGLN